MLRLAEVYLNLADAILATTHPRLMLRLCNTSMLCALRAGLEAKSSIDHETLRHERRMEFAFEGLYWYDLVRRAYYKQQEVVNYLNNQDRNHTYKYDAEAGAYKPSEKPGRCRHGHGCQHVAAIL